MGKKRSEYDRPGFMMYYELLDALKEYDAHDIVIFLYAMRDYTKDGLEPLFEDRGLRSIWKLAQPSLDKDNDNYIDRVRKSRYSAYVSVQKRKFTNNPDNSGKKPVEGIDYLIYEDWFLEFESKQSAAEGSGCQLTLTKGSERQLTLTKGSQLNKNKNKNKNNNCNNNYNNNYTYPDREQFLLFCKDQGIEEDFCTEFFGRYHANGWTAEDGEPIKNWRNLLLSAWRKEKKQVSVEEKPKQKKRSYTLDDCVEYPPGSGEYIGKDELEAMQHG